MSEALTRGLGSFACDVQVMWFTIDEDRGMEAEMSLTITGLASDGAGIARDVDGRVVFVEGALPGETVFAFRTTSRKDFARAVAKRIDRSVPERCEPSCVFVRAGCGGCGWQHVRHDAQTSFKRDIVLDALRRIARLPTPSFDESRIVMGPTLSPAAFRTSVRAAVEHSSGRFGFRASRSHEIVAATTCEVTDPRLDVFFRHASARGAHEVSLRVAKSGEVTMLVDPTARSVVIPSERVLADVGVCSVHVLDTDDVVAGRSVSLTEDVAGASFVVSASSFFQTRVDGAELLVATVHALIDEVFGAAPVLVASGLDLLLDLYGGVGLFACTVGTRFRSVVSVERDGSSARDARVNVRQLVDGLAVAADIDRWDPAPYVRDRSVVVVADPPRAGLGKAGVATVHATGTSVVVLISCDVASYARDVGLLAKHGFDLQRSVLIDLFPHTPRVEIVSLLLKRH